MGGEFLNPLPQCFLRYDVRNMTGTNGKFINKLWNNIEKIVAIIVAIVVITSYLNPELIPIALVFSLVIVGILIIISYLKDKFKAWNDKLENMKKEIEKLEAKNKKGVSELLIIVFIFLVILFLIWYFSQVFM